MTKILDRETIDPTIDSFCYLISLIIKEVNPAINQEVAHDMLVEMVESQLLTEPDAIDVGRMIRATSSILEKAGLH